MDSKVVLKDGMAFEAHASGHTFMIDATEGFGGQNLGPSPKTLTLTSLSGCTAMDVISLLRKMRVEVDSFEVETESPLAEEHPKRFTDIVVRYKLTGKDLPEDKVKKAVNLSMDRYCGVIAALKPGCPVRGEIYLNGEKLAD